MSTSSFVASSKGKRIGFIAASAGEEQVLIHVAPKAFEGARRRDVSLTSWSDRAPNRVGLTETQRLHVYDEGARAFMDDLVGRLTDKAESQRGRRGLERGSVESLLSQTSTPVAFREPPTAEPDDSIDQSESDVVALLYLFERTGFLDLDSDAVDGVDRVSPLLRPLLVRRFLDEVGRRIPQLRRGYRTVTEHRGVVRGRVAASSLAQLRATGVPRVTCTYDELTESTDLLRVLATALEAVADGRGRSSVFPGRYAEPALRHDAVVCRRRLESVDPLPARSALLVGRRLRLNRLDQPLAVALQLALRILASIQAEPAGGGIELDAAEISVETEKIWERIVTDALKSIDPALTVLTPKEQTAANRDQMWSVRESVRPEPDNLVIRDSDMLVFDAKYKAAGTRPGRDDQYQMFAYSHLIGTRSRPTSSLVLVYPTDETAPAPDLFDEFEEEGEAEDRVVTGVRDVRAPRPWSRGSIDGEIAGAPQLSMLKLRFPGPPDLEPGAWPAYIDSVAQVLASFIAEADARRT